MRKLINVYHHGIPIETMRPHGDRIVLRAIRPDELDGALAMHMAEGPCGLFEVVSLGDGAETDCKPGDIVLPVPEALRGLGTGEHLMVASKEIAGVWDREQLEVPEAPEQEPGSAPGLARLQEVLGAQG